MKSDAEQEVDDISFWADIAAGLLLVAILAAAFFIGCIATAAWAGLVTHFFS